MFASGQRDRLEVQPLPGRGGLFLYREPAHRVVRPVVAEIDHVVAVSFRILPAQMGDVGAGDIRTESVGDGGASSPDIHPGILIMVEDEAAAAEPPADITGDPLALVSVEILLVVVFGLHHDQTILRLKAGKLGQHFEPCNGLVGSVDVFGDDLELSEIVFEGQVGDRDLRTDAAGNGFPFAAGQSPFPSIGGGWIADRARVERDGVAGQGVLVFGQFDDPGFGAQVVRHVEGDAWPENLHPVVPALIELDGVFTRHEGGRRNLHIVVKELEMPTVQGEALIIVIAPGVTHQAGIDGLI